MKWRLMILILLVTVAVLPSCATVMPNTAEVLEPHGFEGLAIAIAADVEAWIEIYGTYGLAGFILLP